MHFTLTTGPRSGYSAISGAGLSSCHLSLIIEKISIECKLNRHYFIIKHSQKKKKKKELPGHLDALLPARDYSVHSRLFDHPATKVPYIEYSSLGRPLVDIFNACMSMHMSRLMVVGRSRITRI